MKPDLVIEFDHIYWYYYYQFSEDLIVEVHNDNGEQECYTHQGRKEVLRAIEELKKFINHPKTTVTQPYGFENIEEVFY
jgi:hypothetical protein